jgi:hypothetical protein
LYPEKEKMLHRDKKIIQSKQLRITENIAAGLFSWPIGVLKRIARIFTLPEKPCVIVPQKESDKRAERPAFPARCIVFSDTDNDVNSVKNTLRFAGILDEKDELTDNLEGISIFHTGDLIDKKNPDPSVV